MAREQVGMEGGEPAPHTVPPAPVDAGVKATNLAATFAKEAGLSDDDAERLRAMVREALDERFAEVQDLRLGRVLGSALATL